MDVVRNPSHRYSGHPILPSDPAKKAMKPVSHFFLYTRPAVGGSEDDVNQAANIARRHKPQSSLTGLLFLLERFPPLGFVA